jgi:hypothetical protein
MCLTNLPANRIDIPKPANYDPTYWELFRRYLKAAGITGITQLMNIGHMPNNKTDINNNGPISTDFIGGSWTYPTASPAQRALIYQQHKDYTQGFFYFLGHDAEVPQSVRTQMLEWGFSKDEFVDNGYECGNDRHHFLRRSFLQFLAVSAVRS